MPCLLATPFEESFSLNLMRSLLPCAASCVAALSHFMCFCCVNPMRLVLSVFRDRLASAWLSAMLGLTPLARPTPRVFAPKFQGTEGAAVKVKVTESAVLYTRVSKFFCEPKVWAAFEKAAAKEALQWVACRHDQALDSLSWTP